MTLLLYWPFCSLSGFFYCQILSEYLSIPCIKSIAKVKSLQGFILSGNAPFSPVNFFSWVRAFLWMLRSKEENVEQHLWQIKILYCLRWWGTGAGDKDKDLLQPGWVAFAPQGPWQPQRGQHNLQCEPHLTSTCISAKFSTSVCFLSPLWQKHFTGWFTSSKPLCHVSLPQESPFQDK